MELKKRFGFLPLATLSVISVYTFMVLSYLFLMSGTPKDSGNYHTCHLKRKTECALTVQRIDKTVLTENKPINTVRMNSFILLYIKVPVLTFKTARNKRLAVLTYLSDHVYLSNRNIRV